MRTLYGLRALAAALLAGCGWDDNPSPTNPDVGSDNSSYSATVTGLTGIDNVRGDAAFGENTGSAAAPFAIALGDANNPNGLFFFRPQPGRPGNGAYAVADVTGSTGPAPEEFGLVAEFGSGTSTQFACGSTGGALTVSASSTGGMEGTFEVRVSCAVLGGRDEVAATISGNFSAVNFDTTVPTLSISRFTFDK
jgi:hypothetical protein